MCERESESSAWPEAPCSCILTVLVVLSHGRMYCENLPFHIWQYRGFLHTRPLQFQLTSCRGKHSHLLRSRCNSLLLNLKDQTVCCTRSLSVASSLYSTSFVLKYLSLMESAFVAIHKGIYTTVCFTKDVFNWHAKPWFVSANHGLFYG